MAPVYYHNYMMGEMMASQLQRRVLEEMGGGSEAAWERALTSPAVGRFLVENLYAPGRSIDWREAMRRATGASLRSDAFVAELSTAD